MSYKAYAIVLCISLSCSFTKAQTTYFIKYNNWVSRTQISQKISTGRFLSAASPIVLNKSAITAGYFANNLGKSDQNLSRIVKITFPSTAAAENFLQIAKTDPSIQYIEPEHVYKIDSVPNDSLVSDQWALKKIDAFNAWNITEGSDTVLIGIIDTGIDYLHPDLRNKIFINPGETGTDKTGENKESNGIDDDGNGFIDDYMGWDFTDRRGFPFDSTGGDYLGWDNNPMDENGHGTFIAGIIAAQTNNRIGIAGAAPDIKILNIRAFDPSGYGEEDDVAAGILYAVKMGVKVINMSFGDTQYSEVLKDVIKYAYDRGVVLVASSGNSGDESEHYPSGYSEVISVGNSTQDDYVASSSSYGSTLDLVAPGTDILTTAKGGGYSTVSGTSASAPFVSAAAGLILSKRNFTNEEVKQILKYPADDIDTRGWDEHSGAGRLNLFRALSVLAPSVVKFNSPLQDFATDSDSLAVNASILSAYFQSYALYIGTGLNPQKWTTLIQNGTYQFDKRNIYSLNTASLADSVYCLRLVVNMTTGFSAEERVNFYVERKSPELILNYTQAALYGSKPTILASVSTNQLTRSRIYFRKKTETSFNFVSLDGFATNIQTINKEHYGFIPTDLISPNSDYDIYFEAENLVGKKTIFPKDGSYIKINTALNSHPGYEKTETYKLPAGDIYKNPVSITTGDTSDIFLREAKYPSTTYLYHFDGNSFTKLDSLPDRIVKDVGDFNNNGKKDLLTYLVYNGYIDEQDSEYSHKFSQKFIDTAGKFWPITAANLYGNKSTEILAVDSDTSFVIRNVNTDLSLSSPVRLVNYTPKGNWNNYLDAPHAVLGDLDGSGKNEIWMIDKEGDIFSYLVNGPGSFSRGKSIQTGLESSSALIAAGNYTGNGNNDLAVILKSPSETNTIPFYKLMIFGLKNDSMSVIYDQMFVNPSDEFNSSFNKVENGIRFSDIDNDGKDELIVFIYPYSYIFKYQSGENEIISYKENINSSSIFVGDLNKNGVKEVGFPTSNGITFSEFVTSNIASAPYNLRGYAIDSNSANLTWSGNAVKFFIYRGTAEKLILIDSTSSNQYTDRNVSYDTEYYYAVKAYDPGFKIPLSNFSGTIQVYIHNPAQVDKVYSNTDRSIIINFSDRINTKIQNLHAFSVVGHGYPNSVTANDQYSYLITYNNPFSEGNYQLTVNNLNDFYGSPISPDTVGFSVSAYTGKKEFYIISHQILDAYTVQLDFNLPVDSVSASNLKNYVFSPTDNVTGLRLSINHQSIILSLKGAKPVGSVGIEYTLNLKNIYSSDESGRVEINSGAGSYIVLTKFANDLSGVYVYPSPAHINGGEGKMTFANLPQMSSITIFDISGRKINQLEDKSGKGGVVYNLKDESGNYLNSGIYLYRIVKLDDQNREIDEKIGKFAVIK